MTTYNEYPRNSEDVQEDRPLLNGDENSFHETEYDDQDVPYVYRILAPLKRPETLRPLERLLLIVSLVLLLLFAIFAGLYAGARAKFNRSHDNPNASDAVCTTPECVLTASQLLHSIDSSVNPCDDFYSFSVGTWLKEHPIPGDAGLFGMAQKIGVDNAQVMHKYLVDDEDDQPSILVHASTPEEASNLGKLRDFYQSCVDSKAQDKAGAAPLVDIVAELKRHLFDQADGRDTLMGSLTRNLWSGDMEQQGIYVEQPVVPPNRPPARHPPSEKPTPLPPRKGRQAGLTRSLAWAHSRGLPALFDWFVEGEPVHDPTKGTAYLGPEGLGFPDKVYYEDEDEVVFYKKSVTEALSLLDEAEKSQHIAQGNEVRGSKKQDIAKLAELVVDFETYLARITPEGEDLEDPVGTYNPTTVTALTYQFPSIDWPTYLSALTHKIPKSIIVQSPHYIQRLDALVSRTKTEVLSAYFAWTAIRTFGLQLGPNVALRRPVDALDRRAKGVDPDAKEDRDTVCFAATNEALGLLAGHFYLKDAFSSRARTIASNIIDSIIQAFKSRLPELAWLDPKTRSKAEVKANAIRIKVGWPLSPNTTDASAIQEYYKDLSVDKSDYFGNVARSLARGAKRTWASVERPLDTQTWDMIPSEVNAYYNPGGNEIVFPAGILQPQYFSEHWPSYLQYGAFGNVAGHELSHAFDPSGRLFDEKGRLSDWWTNETAQAFNKRRDCLIDQYEQYTIPDGKGGQQHLRSKFTIGEDVADAGGMAQSYRAWQDSLRTGGQAALDANPLLPGLPYTREQLFFVAFGIGWARNIRTQEAIRRLRTDEHSATKYRVIGTLSNNPDFARAFGCKAGIDRMARSEEQRCSIW